MIKIVAALLDRLSSPIAVRTRLLNWWPDNRLKFALRLARLNRNAAALRHVVIALRERRGERATRHLVAINRTTNHISISCLDWMIRAHQNELYHRLRAVFAVIAGLPSMRFEAIADISDGEDSAPGLLSFCSSDPRAILIPDHLFVCSTGYERYRNLAMGNRTAWKDRSDTIVWRGSTTGTGQITKEVLRIDDAGLLLRVRLCLALRETSRTDCKLSGVVQSNDVATDTRKLAQAGLLGPYIAPMAWYKFKFAIDVDGNSNAWSNLYIRLIMGCCVLKIASPSGFRQWYYDDLKPWVHFVPVHADLSDLQQMISWCRANPAECERIAECGQRFVMERDCDGEITAAAHRVQEAHEEGRLRTSL